MINLPFFTKKEIKVKPLVLLVIDGFGLAPPSGGNAISLARTPHYQSYLKDYPQTELIASGESVGLPANEVGNTEVGHLTLGAGRVILQDLKRINLAIEKGFFYDNKAFLQASSHVKESNSKFHIMGLVGSGNVHSSLEHLYALIQFCKKEGIDKVFLHLFTDGRDSPPQEAKEIVEQVENRLKNLKIGKIASISGRYFAMGWERTERVYKALVLSQAIQVRSSPDAIKSAYAKNQTDEFIEPTLIADEQGPIARIEDNDAVIFFNFRIDRSEQLAMAFVLPNFETLKSFDFGYDPETDIRLRDVQISATFQREKVPKNLFFVSMTEYEKNLPVSAVAFGPEVVENPLSLILSRYGLKQMHMAESEKERFVKYYFNGLREEPVDGEDDLVVPSPKVATYDQKPEMSLPGLVKEAIRQVNKDKYHFFVINFANPDMVAHTGDLNKTVKAIEYVDEYMGKLIEAVLKVNGTMFVTADHGNAEELLTYPTSAYFYTTAKGSKNTDHSNNPVPLIIINNRLKGAQVKLAKGSLADVGSTILTFLNIPVPSEMQGKNLLY